MPETVGLLDLKIAQLERRLKLLKQQQSLSQPYPLHQAKLRQQDTQVQLQLQQLLQRRAELQQYGSSFLVERSYDEFSQRQRSVCQAA